MNSIYLPHNVVTDGFLAPTSDSLHVLEHFDAARNRVCQGIDRRLRKKKASFQSEFIRPCLSSVLERVLDALGALLLGPKSRAASRLVWVVVLPARGRCMQS